MKGAGAGSELILKNDSSFVYTTCGNIMDGTWNLRHKTLFLTITSNHFRVESLNDSFPPITQPFPIMKFHYTRKKFYSTAHTELGNYIDIFSKSE